MDVTQIDDDDGVNDRIMTVTNHRTGLTTFSINYMVAVVWFGGADPAPICNEITVENNTITLGQQQVCACPDGREFCPEENICTPVGTPC